MAVNILDDIIDTAECLRGAHVYLLKCEVDCSDPYKDFKRKSCCMCYRCGMELSHAEKQAPDRGYDTFVFTLLSRDEWKRQGTSQ